MKQASSMYQTGRFFMEFTVHLPAADPVCSYCQGCIYDTGRRFRYCFFTGEHMPAFDMAIGAECPVKWGEVLDK